MGGRARRPHKPSPAVCEKRFDVVGRVLAMVFGRDALARLHFKFHIDPRRTDLNKDTFRASSEALLTPTGHVSKDQCRVKSLNIGKEENSKDHNLMLTASDLQE